MKKKLWGIALAMAAASLLAWQAPASATMSRNGAAAPFQTPQETASSTASQPMQLVLSGKILIEHGHYVFYNLDTKSTFRIANPSKVKRYKGDTVKVEGRFLASTHHLYITKINSIM
jgi:hypothetical protein